MAVRPILTLGNPILRQKAKRIKHIDKSLDPLIQDMIDTMHAAPGIGLAAPQIGIPLRLMVIEIEGELTTLINPEIIKMQDEWEPEEGCLSIPGYVANVKRAWAVTVKAKNRRGRDVRLKGEGLFGHALQHEIDHLDGILYIDRLESLDRLRKTDRREGLDLFPDLDKLESLDQLREVEARLRRRYGTVQEPARAG